ncbi:Unknown protein [Striga hermonthica]|uniref:Uncharacterized protein n=1 Tax=Striga hermonthica TaxID=68872 RepID=A0A9N7MNC7_STRHE|nr:Unknown protein [Striga hermonthica]
MGRNFLLALLIFSSLFLIPHARAGRSGAGMLIFRPRALLRDLESETSIARPPTESGGGEGEERGGAAEAPTVLDSSESERHHSADRSVAGGGVIIGGLVTAVFAAVYCYIRVTRKRAAPNLV